MPQPMPPAAFPVTNFLGDLIRAHFAPPMSDLLNGLLPSWRCWPWSP